MNENTKRLLANQLIWAGIYFGIAIVVAFVLDLPCSFLVMFAIIAPLSIYRRRRYLKKNGR